MKKLSGSGILLCLFEVLVGILLLIDPVGFTSGIITAAGLLLLLVGLVSIFKYFRAAPEDAAESQFLTNGLLAILAGCFCVFRSQWFVATFPVLTIVYGILILITGVGKIQLTVDLLRVKSKKWFVAAINAAISLICAAVILSSPFSTTAALWTFTGISLIIASVIDLITLILKKAN